MNVLTRGRVSQEGKEDIEPASSKKKNYKTILSLQGPDKKEKHK